VTSSQIEFKPLKGSKAFGYPADLLPKVCEVFLRARDEGDGDLFELGIIWKTDFSPPIRCNDLKI
jgi:hypothetical protein